MPVSFNCELKFMLKFIVLNVMLFLQPQHLTMTSIEYIPGSDSLKVTVSLVYDQLLHDYQQTIIDDIDLEALRKYRLLPADLINSYINSKLFITINKRLLTGKLLNTESSGNSIVLTMLYRLDRKIKTITVRNTILTGLYSDIENLTIIRINDFETGVKFTHDYTEETFNIK